ncbi:hypothetical protein BOX15_Mlig007612g3, partial [Macrostomum lignano]
NKPKSATELADFISYRADKELSAVDKISQLKALSTCYLAKLEILCALSPMAANISTRDAWLMDPHLVDPVIGVRRLLYLVTPAETTFEAVNSVPNLIDESVPYFLLLIGLEYAILTLKGRNKSMPINDSLISLTMGIFSQLPLLFTRSVEVSVYLWIWENCRLVDIPVDSTLAWFATLMGVDFCFYWVHRATHEVNLIWASHQVHHSSERFNLTTALRQPVLQRYLVWILYTPLALILPPQLFATHLQLNMIYQFWIHTETIPKLPEPIEFVFNTPSHHRVHHGRNAYCIDRNYGGVFILFDRLFGTFRAERDNEPPVFGLVTPESQFDPLSLQLDHLKQLAQSVRLPYLSWTDRLKLLVYGPSWQPGTAARLGPGIYPEIRYPVRPLNPRVPSWTTAYATVHFIAALAGYGFLTAHRSQPMLLLVGCAVIVWALTGVARTLEDRVGLELTAKRELLRCSVTAAVCALMQPWLCAISRSLLIALYSASAAMWLGLGTQSCFLALASSEKIY